jgi:wobble nucleotide-excising tRNase
MINKVNKIKDFGIFKDFVWDSLLTPFKKRNLIYGSNYSGKTTFSKLFNNLEKKEKFHFPNAEYTFEIDSSPSIITQHTLQSFPYLVKVFNANYIKAVFSWDKENNEGFEPILFYLGDEAGDIQPKIDRLEDKWNPEIDKIKKHYGSIVNLFQEYAKESGKFSKQATEIRKYLNDQLKSNEFNKGNVITIINNIKENPNKYTLSGDRLNEIKQQAIAINDYSEQNEKYTLTENLINIGQKVKHLLDDSAPQSIPFPELDSNRVLFNWVQTGLEFHSSSLKCKFCDNVINPTRIEALNQYYSQKLKEIQNAIKEINNNIKEEEINLNFNFPSENKIAKHLIVRYNDALNIFNEQRKKYISELTLLSNDLKNKEDNFFVPIEAKVFYEISLINELQNVINVINEHNLFVADFDENRKKALNVILNHFVADYIISENYLSKENEYKLALDIIRRCDKRIGINNSELLRLKSLLKDTVKGQTELNLYLKIFLNQNDIQIDISNNKYVLKRGTQFASNLSEGEKTAIAFAYFLTELKSYKKEDKLKNTIIYFDDPISSLDSNHIFQVRSLIQNFFCNENDYLQLFISTHNFEFFSVLLDSTLFNNKASSQDKSKPFYFISRKSSNESTFKNLPKSLRSHKSEYAHLFHILKDYNSLSNKDEFEYKVLLPNTLRRFLELYSLFKYPKGYCEVDERLKKIFSEDEIVFHNTKLYHWFSHQQQLEKVAQHDSKLMLIDEAISEMLIHIENKDPLHWLGLTSIDN